MVLSQVGTIAVLSKGPEVGKCYIPLKWLAVPLVWGAWEALYVDWWPRSRLSGSVLKPGLMWQTCEARSTLRQPQHSHGTWQS